MKLQEIIDTVYKNLKDQKFASIGVMGYCKYRGPYGRKCAVGGLIPDNKYSPSLEGYGIYNEDVQAALKSLKIPEKGIDLLGALQSTHDDIFNHDPNTYEFNMSRLNKSFARIAKTFNLKNPAKKET